MFSHLLQVCIDKCFECRFEAKNQEIQKSNKNTIKVVVIQKTYQTF